MADDRLADWVRALAPHVQAVSFYEPILAGRAGVDRHAYSDIYGLFRPELLLREGVAVLDAVAAPPVALRVLDIACVPVHWDDLPKGRIYAALVAALRHNAGTLRELALPVSTVCVRALDSVQLPALEVAAFEHRAPKRWSVWKCEIEHMLRALQNSVAGVRDLRLAYSGKPLLCTKGLSAPFLRSVRTLDVRTFRKDLAAETPAICESFPELRCVRWNSRLDVAGMQWLVAACPQLEEIHFDALFKYGDIRGRYSHVHIVDYPLALDRNVTELPLVFAAARDKLRSVALHGEIPAEVLHWLANDCPNLLNLALDVRPSNVAALVPLLGGQCRSIQSLRLQYAKHNWRPVEALGTAGWRTLTEAVCSASDALREVMVMNMDPLWGGEEDVEALVAAMCEMLKRLGNRAQKVVFHVKASTWGLNNLFRAVRRVLEAATEWCENLEWLEVDLIMDSCLNYDSFDREQLRFEEALLLRAREQLWASALGLHFLGLGYSKLEKMGFWEEAKALEG